MNTIRDYPPITCAQHPSVFLVDLLGDDNVISPCCPECTSVRLINIPRQLYRRADGAGRGAVE
jgi:hypothetical protein